MKENDILQRLGNRPKGAIATFETHRPCETYKNADAVVTKRTIMQLRIGHSYEAQASTREAREEGREKLEAAKLWHEPAPDLDGGKNLFRRHKGNGTTYVCGQPTGNKAQVVFFLNGKEATREEVEPFLTAKEKRSSKSNYTFLKTETVDDVR